MKMKSLVGAFLVGLLAVAQGCGGGGGSSLSGPAPGSTVLTGTATKGPIVGGTVKVYEIISSATSNPRSGVPRLNAAALAQGTTGSDGSYNITLPPGSAKGGLLVQVTGGNYQDEATGASRSMDDQFGPSGMRAIFGNISSAARGGQLSGYVTPFTEMAYQAAGGDLSAQGIDDANRRVAGAFGLPDLTKTKPLDPNKPFPAGATDDSKKYALALASLSQYQKDYGAGKKMSQLESELESEATSGSLSSITDAKFRSSGNNYAAGSANPNPGLLTSAENADAPVEIQITPAAGTLPIGGSYNLSATVKKNGGSPVPDGTLVSFSSTFGTLSASSAATVGGIANVTLSASQVGSAGVTIRSGAVSVSSGPYGFFDPNAPAGLTLSLGASQGIVNGQAVQVSANVSRVAGGPVPNGSVVSFAISSGSGLLSGASTTSNGIATVNLTSAVAGSVTVSASIGSLNQSIPVNFVVQPTKAIVKVRSTGTLPQGTLIGGIGATVTYASGKGLSIGSSSAEIAVSGAGLGSTMIPNVNTPGQVTLGLLNVSGIGAGEFATLNFTIAAGNFPTIADFGISGSGLSIIDTGTNSIPGMGVGIASVTLQ
ncbi:hypothetical protein GMLC_23930 [Geomonas limicola]|uniref:Big-1 domain-containing protein n=1 Tax=Geomonas limicola TaxID=2740186 RepID=A0A6V8NAA6_9BACT|nr:Ig-like domain-containing protein [Geomonas limicola]GFO68814.1 hypothetical protein GMLC_23930 [Geomonas limicola]